MLELEEILKGLGLGKTEGGDVGLAVTAMCEGLPYEGEAGDGGEAESDPGEEAESDTGEGFESNTGSGNEVSSSGGSILSNCDGQNG